MKNFFKTKGYYIILIVCIVATCVGGVVALQRSGDDDQEILSYTTASPAPGASSGNQSPGKTPAPTDVAAMNPVTPEPSANPDASPSPSPAPVKMTKPVEGDIIQAYAADRLVYNKTLQEWRTHKGLDIAADSGTDVLCAYVGTVSDIKYDPRYGDTIIVDHGAGLKTVYCGVKAAEGIAVGHAVEAGTVLGNISGDIFCEKEDGAHLHFEILQDGKNADPGLYLG